MGLEEELKLAADPVSLRDAEPAGRPFKKSRALRMVWKTFYCLRTYGLRLTWKKVVWKLAKLKRGSNLPKEPLFSEAELAKQREAAFSKDITFSIIVPLYNTPKRLLREMIQSVIDQTYVGWELCMADGSDLEHGEVERICREYAQKHARVKYRRLEKNFGIAGNMNACLAMATGDYIGLLDHDDLLHPAALHEVMKAICEKDADFVYTDETVFHRTPNDAYRSHFKPDYAPDTLRGNNYICHFTVFKRSLLDIVGEFDPLCDGAQDFDMVLRLTEKAKSIVHIPEILYYWRAHSGSVAESIDAKPYAVAAGHRALEAHLRRLGLDGEVLDAAMPTLYRIRYAIHGTPRVSILIPNNEHMEELQKCLESVMSKTSYPCFDVTVIENNSVSSRIFDYYEDIQKRWQNVRVISWQGRFNYSAINNFGAGYSTGEYLLLFNNDTEVISSDWIQEMLMFAQRPDVGVVGAKLYYPNDTVQHAGVLTNNMSLAVHFHRGFDREHAGYMGRLIYAQDLSAVTGACMMIRRDVWDSEGGLDESLAVAFNDIDFCMRVRKSGRLVVWTPFAELYHSESKSRGPEDTPDKKKRFESEADIFRQRWHAELLAGDPYSNPNLL